MQCVALSTDGFLDLVGLRCKQGRTETDMNGVAVLLQKVNAKLFVKESRGLLTQLLTRAFKQTQVRKSSFAGGQSGN
jgi:hypothetical protein